WRFDCGSDRCDPPLPHVDCEHLRRPSALRVLPGGELWVGDMSSESLARVSPEGEILLSYTSLRSPPVPGKAVGVQLASR
ncbi:MAG: hypothetical protein MI919_18615, partial [Holophagales bacterium]|nr:hypothetical protein [Holophagales bacterium]